ncbi:hypothetical protein [Flavihumibacter petaseus]|nr:hypothetical protein [Flavihumibacter petaseus]
MPIDEFASNSEITVQASNTMPTARLSLTNSCNGEISWLRMMERSLIV